MSETYSESQSILVPHNNEVQVWELTDRKDEDGNPIVQSQIEDEIDGVFGRTEKSARPGALSEDVQAGLARILAMDRNPTAEQLERGLEGVTAQKDIGERALGDVGVENPGKVAETVRLEKLIKNSMDTLSESDRAAVWQYATALYENEMGSALDKMSPEVKASHVPGDMAELYRQLKKARDLSNK